MTLDSMSLLLPALTAALVTLLATPFVGSLATSLRAVDVPGGRKRHGGLVPRLGGVAIVAGLVAAALASRLAIPDNGWLGLPSASALWLAAATGLVFLIGVLDDLVGLGPPAKLAIQVVAATVVVSGGWQFVTFEVPFTPWTVGPLAAAALSLAWIVGVTNAMNFIDGLDGLAVSVSTLIAAFFLVLGILRGDTVQTWICAAVVGAGLGFLPHNWMPARIHMGDSGALTLGFVLAVVSVAPSSSRPVATALVALLALGMPVFDSLIVIGRRLVRGNGDGHPIARMFRGDRTHLHHLMLRLAGPRSSVLYLALMNVVFCGFALLVAATRAWRLGLVLLLAEAAITAFLRRWSHRTVRPEIDRDRIEELKERRREISAAHEADKRERQASSLRRRA